jgi:hypothetical protein
MEEETGPSLTCRTATATSSRSRTASKDGYKVLCMTDQVVSHCAAWNKLMGGGGGADTCNLRLTKDGRAAVRSNRYLLWSVPDCSAGTRFNCSEYPDTRGPKFAVSLMERMSVAKHQGSAGTMQDAVRLLAP